ncbi:MAG: hypothetical protein ACXVXP_03540 [Mycobacteriaceae bacterium]
MRTDAVSVIAHGPSRSVRRLFAVTFVLIGVLVATVLSVPYRGMEALLASRLTGLITPTFNFDDRWVVEGQPGRSLILIVTAACTSSLLVGPLFFVAAWAVLQQRMRPWAVVSGLLCAMVIVLGIGTVRMSLIGLAWHSWGRSSAWVSHDVTGTVLTLLSGVIGLATLFLVAARLSPAPARRFIAEATREQPDAHE